MKGHEQTLLNIPDSQLSERLLFLFVSACPLSSFSFLQGFPCGSSGKESACNAGDLGLIPGLGGSPEEGKGYPLQYSGLENSMSMESQRVGHTEWLSLFTFVSPGRESWFYSWWLPISMRLICLLHEEIHECHLKSFSFSSKTVL